MVMDAEEWFAENGYEGVRSEITPTYQTVEGYSGFYENKLKADIEVTSLSEFSKRSLFIKLHTRM